MGVSECSGGNDGMDARSRLGILGRIKRRLCKRGHASRASVRRASLSKFISEVMTVKRLPLLDSWCVRNSCACHLIVCTDFSTRWLN